MALAIERDLTGEAPASGLAEALVLFRRSGWGSWTEFLAQPEAVRRLAASVGERVEEERVRALAAFVAVALVGPAGVAEVLGDAATRQEVAEAEVARGARRPEGGF